MHIEMIKETENSHTTTTTMTMVKFARQRIRSKRRENKFIENDAGEYKRAQ